MKDKWFRLIRHIGSYIFGNVLILLGIVNRGVKKAADGTRITSIYFHNPKKELFEKSIKWLINHRYCFISIDELCDILEKKKKTPPQPVLITLDDAYKDNMPNVIDVALKYNVPVTIFAPTDSVETGCYWWKYVIKGIKYASCEFKSIGDFKKMPEWKRREQVELIKQNISIESEAMSVDDLKRISTYPHVTIGSHTVNHPITINCEDHELDYELKVSKEKLESWTGKEVRYFAYPIGQFNDRDKIFLKKYRYRLAFTTVPKHIDLNDFHVYELPRYCVIGSASFAENICRMAGVWGNVFNLRRLDFLT